MSFLAPLFFAGLATLAIPVLIHLIQKERKNVVVFPSLMFLKRVPYESVRRRRIHNWALLAMRLGALALIVAAFARPFLRGTSVAASAGGARDVVILLDRSYSMGHGDQWQRAQRAASDAVNGLAAGDRASLVFFSTSAEVAVRPTNERARLLSEINAATPSAGATRLGPAFKLAGSLLAESSFPRREVIVISDFQRSGWTASDGFRLPDATTVTPVVVNAGNVTNVAVTPVSVQREVFAGQERVIVTGGAINRSATPIKDLNLSLEIDGRAVQSVPVSLEPHGAATAAFAPVTITADNTRAVVRLPDDGLAADNAFHFVLTPPRPIEVALVTRGTRGSALYLSRALAIGENPRITVTTRTADALSEDVLSKSRVIIFDDINPSDATAARLKRFVENGGGIFVVGGPQSSWSGAAADLLPGTAAGSVDRTRGAAGTVGGLAYGHAVFEPFRAPRSGDFSAARFYGYRTVTAAMDAQVLARFDDGAPALVERQTGRGRVLFWTSTLDLYWNDLALKPVFLPFVHQVVRHLSSYRERPSFATVGQVIDLTEFAAPAGPATSQARTGRLVLTPSGKREDLEGDQSRVLELAEQGFYEIREARAGSPAAVAASNVELIESDVTAADPQEIAMSVTSGGRAAGGSGQPIVLPDEAQERTQRLWWYLLFAGILLLTGESLVAHRMSRSA
jgi:Aerotolerance regulator N-terminal/von Willebrand factor type A domain/Putative glutamine amidotransferase